MDKKMTENHATVHRHSAALFLAYGFVMISDGGDDRSDFHEIGAGANNDKDSKLSCRQVRISRARLSSNLDQILFHFGIIVGKVTIPIGTLLKCYVILFHFGNYAHLMQRVSVACRFYFGTTSSNMDPGTTNTPGCKEWLLSTGNWFA
jgi:hypothetical protein